MPSFLPAGFLTWIMLAGSALAAGLLLGAVAVRVLRALLGGRRARAEREMRPMVLAVASGADIPPELVAARGGLGRAAERIVFAYLARVRGESATFLAEVLSRRGVVTRLISQTHSPRAHTRARAAERLGLIAAPQAEHRLAELVTGDQNPEVRIVATRALGKTGSAAAARTLLHSLSRPAPVPEGIVASALLELGQEAVPGLRAELVGGRRQRAMAANLLGLLDEMPAWQGLVENASGGSVEVRASAVRALGRLGLPQGIGPVTACLHPSEDLVLRATAAHALGRIGDPRSAGPLAACLNDPHYWVAHNAAMALAEIGDAGLTELTLAAAGLGSAAAHAREALARRALARGERPPAPAAVADRAADGTAPAGQAPAAPAPDGGPPSRPAPSDRPATRAPDGPPATPAPGGRRPAAPVPDGPSATPAPGGRRPTAPAPLGRPSVIPIPDGAPSAAPAPGGGQPAVPVPGSAPSATPASAGPASLTPAPATPSPADPAPAGRSAAGPAPEPGAAHAHPAARRGGR